MLTEIFKNSLEKSMSYEDYLALTEQLIAQNRTTGEDQSEQMVAFTQLNFKRMQRLNKTFNLSDETTQILQKINQKQLWLLITEAWCGDASQIVPIINKMAKANPNFELKLVLRDENEPLMNQFLTNGGKAIPVLIIIDKQTLMFIEKWGARPAGATKLVEECKAKFGKFTAECKEDLQKWYNQDKGQSIVNEIVNLLTK